MLPHFLQLLIKLSRSSRGFRRIAVRFGFIARMKAVLREPMPYVSGRKARVIDHYDLGVVGGLFRPLSSDEIVFQQVFYGNELYSFIKRLGRMRDSVHTIIDAGANVGFTAIYLARLFPRSQIIALEPDDSNYAQAKKNLHMNGIVSVKLIKAALWSKRESLAVVRPDNSTADFSVRVTPEDAASSNDMVMGLTIDDLMMAHKWECLDILKLDIEGAEKELFGKCLDEWLSKVGSLSVEPHEGYSSRDQLAVKLKERGWQIAHCGELLFASNSFQYEGNVEVSQ